MVIHIFTIDVSLTPNNDHQNLDEFTRCKVSHIFWPNVEPYIFFWLWWWFFYFICSMFCVFLQSLLHLVFVMILASWYFLTISIDFFFKQLKLTNIHNWDSNPELLTCPSRFHAIEAFFSFHFFHFLFHLFAYCLSCSFHYFT